MKKTLTMAAVIAAAAAIGYAKPKVEPSVNFAPSWEAAVAEAKVLNVPIVVHAHGFN